MKTKEVIVSKNLLSLNDIEISPELEWVRPYLKKVKRIVPVGKVPKILALKATKDKLHNFRAVIWKDEDTGKFERISLYLFVYRTKRIEPYIRHKVVYSKLDLLEHLAHELSHVTYWEHCPNRKILENRICNVFMKMLLDEGYISEEHEMKHNKPKYPTL